VPKSTFTNKIQIKGGDLNATQEERKIFYKKEKGINSESLFDG